MFQVFIREFIRDGAVQMQQMLPYFTIRVILEMQLSLAMVANMFLRAVVCPAMRAGDHVVLHDDPPFSLEGKAPDEPSGAP